MKKAVDLFMAGQVLVGVIYEIAPNNIADRQLGCISSLVQYCG